MPNQKADIGLQVHADYHCIDARYGCAADSVETQLAQIEPERQALRSKASSSQAHLEAAKHRVMQIESDRKKLELEVESRKQQIEKYALQQFQTKKNEEYRALAHEIETCKAAIVKLDDQQLELMEQTEAAQKEVAAASRAATEARKLADEQVADLGAREKNLERELGELEASRDQLAGAVDDGTRSRYERLFKNKGGKVIVGVHHGVCGGCHMKLQPQLVVSCQAQQEVVTCSNCGRILYYTRDMDLAVTE